LAFTLEEWAIAAAERETAEWRCKIFDDWDWFGPPETEDDQHMRNLSRCVRDLLASGHPEAAVTVAIELGVILAQDEWENSIQGALRDRGRREAEAAKQAALRRWGSPEERRKIDEEILAIAVEGVTARNGKQAVHEVARITNERHPGQRITARKVRRVLTGN
jgi:hypothetical protein